MKAIKVRQVNKGLNMANISMPILVFRRTVPIIFSTIENIEAKFDLNLMNKKVRGKMYGLLREDYSTNIVIWINLNLG